MQENVLRANYHFCKLIVCAKCIQSKSIRKVFTLRSKGFFLDIVFAQK